MAFASVSARPHFFILLHACMLPHMWIYAWLYRHVCVCPVLSVWMHLYNRFWTCLLTSPSRQLFLVICFSPNFLHMAINTITKVSWGLDTSLWVCGPPVRYVQHNSSRVPKVVWPPHLSSHQPTAASLIRVGTLAPCPINDGLLSGLVSCWPCVGNCSCCEFCVTSM